MLSLVSPRPIVEWRGDDAPNPENADVFRRSRVHIE
jgi:hypothetical protein